LAPPFYAIAHMANTVRAVDWAHAEGVNALEMDLAFNRDSGEPVAFRHPSFCDCLCSIRAGSVCDALRDSPGGESNPCDAASDPAALLNHVATKSRIALVIIDGKVDSRMTDEAMRRAGHEAALLVARNLFGMDYRGDVVFSVPKIEGTPYLDAVARQLGANHRVFIAIDQEGGQVDAVLEAMRRVGVAQAAFGTGISACVPAMFRSGAHLGAVRAAAGVRGRGGLPGPVYYWGLDDQGSMSRFIDAGAEGIMTNYPRRLLHLIQGRGIRLAVPRLAQ
jgi:glycerophosphoryl diester phosphodiesterase